MDQTLQWDLQRENMEGGIWTCGRRSINESIIHYEITLPLHLIFIQNVRHAGDECKIMLCTCTDMSIYPFWLGSIQIAFFSADTGSDFFSEISITLASKRAPKMVVLTPFAVGTSPFVRVLLAGFPKFVCPHRKLNPAWSRKTQFLLKSKSFIDSYSKIFCLLISGTLSETLVAGHFRSLQCYTAILNQFFCEGPQERKLYSCISRKLYLISSKTTVGLCSINFTRYFVFS